jgi:hypothetical protein
MVELALFDNNYKKNFPKFVYKQQQSDDKLLTQKKMAKISEAKENTVGLPLRTPVLNLNTSLHIHNTYYPTPLCMSFCMPQLQDFEIWVESKWVRKSVGNQRERGRWVMMVFGIF